MFVLERTYDPAELVRHNLHTHSVFSLCAKKEMTLEAMIRRAEEAGLKTLAVTDHSDPGDDIDTYAGFLAYKERLKGIDTPVRVLIGAELSAYGVGKFGEPYEVDKALDLAAYSHIHYHLDSWELHTPTLFRFPAFARRFFFLGKEIGVHFAVGTDAHTLSAIAPEGLADRLAETLRGKC